MRCGYIFVSEEIEMQVTEKKEKRKRRHQVRYEIIKKINLNKALGAERKLHEKLTSVKERIDQLMIKRERERETVISVISCAL